MHEAAQENRAQQPAEPSDVESRPRARQPLSQQLRWPLLLLALLSSLSSAVGVGVWLIHLSRGAEQERLRQLAEAVARFNFPLHGGILRQLRELSGAELALVDQSGEVLASTLELDAPARSHLRSLCSEALKTPKPSDAARSGFALQACRLSSRGIRYEAIVGIRTGEARSAAGGGLAVFRPESDLADELRRIVGPTLAAAIFAGVLSVGIALWLARRLTGPITELMGHIQRGGKEQLLPFRILQRNDELRDLALAIGKMIQDRKEQEHSQQKARQQEWLGQVGLGLAHQLRNTVAGARLAIELHRQDCPQGTRSEELEVGLRQLERIEGILRQFLIAGMSAPVLKEVIDLEAAIRRVVELFDPMFRHMQVHCQLNPFREHVWLCADPVALEQLVTTLVTNAVEAAAEAPQPRQVQISWQLLEDGKGQLTVADTGLGPKPEVQTKLFREPVTSKAGGVGLGLLVAYQIARQLGGELSWQRSGERTEFHFCFPLVNPSNTSPSKSSEVTSRPGVK